MRKKIEEFTINISDFFRSKILLNKVIMEKVFN